MSYQLKRLVLVRSGQPAPVAAAVIGLAVALVGFKIQKLAVMAVGGFVYAGAILFMAQPVISVLLAILGVAGGVLTFFMLPNPEMADAQFTTKLLATVLFSLLYLSLMDTLLLLAAFLYNMLVETAGMSGIRIELAEESEEGEGS